MTIQEEFKKFESRVIPVDALEVQKSEMRMAFISGMFLGNVLVSGIASGDNIEVIETKVAQYFVDIENEVSEYKNRNALDVYREKDAEWKKGMNTN